MEHVMLRRIIVGAALSIVMALGVLCDAGAACDSGDMYPLLELRLLDEPYQG